MFQSDRSPSPTFFIVSLIAVLTLCIYWPVQNYEFVNYDDSIYVLQNSNIQTGHFLAGIGWALSHKYFDLWTPLVYVSFMLDYLLFGFHAGGYHWTNVVFHMLNAILLFGVLKYLTGAVWRSAFVAILFVVHPMNVESVAWVSERKNVLSMFWSLLTLWCYAKYLKHRRWQPYLFMVLCFALALMSKPAVVVLPFVMLLLDHWPLHRVLMPMKATGTRDGRGDGSRKTLAFLFWEKLPLFVLSVMGLFIHFYSRHPAAEPLMPRGGMQRLENAIFSYLMYLIKFFYPVNLHLPYLYLHVPEWQILLSFILLLCLTFGALKTTRAIPYLTIAWLWYVGTLFPAIGIFPIGDHTMADRYAYFPFIGLFIGLAWGIENLYSKISFLKKFLWVSAMGVISLYALLAHHQVKVWANTTTLFENTVRKDPENFVAYQMLAQESAKRNRWDEALRYYSLAVESNARLWPAYNNRGVILKMMGRRREALEDFQQALRINKFSVHAYHNIGSIFYEEKNFDEAIKFFMKAIEIDPSYVESYNYLGVVHLSKGEFEKGIQFFEKALTIDPQNINAARNIKRALSMKSNRSSSKE